VVALDARVDHSATVEDLGITGRPLEESMRDTVRWLVDAGHIKASHAGRALEA
jgi:dihydroflavonol-4-reductase